MQHITQAAELDRFILAGDSNETLRQMVEDYSVVVTCDTLLFVDRAGEILIEASNDLYNLKSGRMDVDAGLVQLKGAWILENLTRSGFATALIRLDTFWFPESGQYYQAETIAAANRGISITRIFLIDKPGNSVNESFMRIIDEQMKAGIDVRFCVTDELSTDLIVDFGIWDDQIVAYVNTAQYSNQIIGATFHNTDADLLRAKRLRERLLQASKSYDEIKSTLVNTSQGKIEN